MWIWATGEDRLVPGPDVKGIPMKTRLHQKRFWRGFTLVEIMIVVLIIAMLLAIAIPNFMKARDVSRAKACQSNLKNLVGAKERWAMDNSRGATDTPTMAELAQPGVYLRSTPECPSSGTYTVGRLDQMPVCSIGGTLGAADAHIVP